MPTFYIYQLRHGGIRHVEANHRKEVPNAIYYEDPVVLMVCNNLKEDIIRVS